MKIMTQTSRGVTGGIDTHGDVHVAAVIDATGQMLGHESFATTTAGYRQLLRQAVTASTQPGPAS